MKSYNVKYDIGQEVYILNNKSIYKSKVEKIRIIEQSPSDLANGTPQQTKDFKSGILIEYLVIIEVMTYGSNNSQKVGFDWYNQADVFSDKEELILAIK
jgi:hypothetical protein